MKPTAITSCLLLTFGLHGVTNASDRPINPTTAQLINQRSTSMQAFTKNMGQWPDSILFRTNAGGATLWITTNGIWYQFIREVEKPAPSPTTIDPIRAMPDPFRHEHDSIETTMIKAEFIGSSKSVEVVELEEQELKCNYFIGNDSSKWRTDVPNYNSVAMRGLYPGVDVTFSVKAGHLQQVMSASSKNDLAQVKVKYCDADEVTPQTDDIAIVQTSIGEHRFEGVLLADESESDSKRPMAPATQSTSDVNLVYSTYLGGSDDEFGQSDFGNGIAVDAQGNAYITGRTSSASFPTENPSQAAGGHWDVFVTKLNSTGNGLIYSTYIGSIGNELGVDIAVDTGGNAYVTGYTLSANFPTKNPFQAFPGGHWDVFVTELNSTGNALIYSTFIGGAQEEYGEGISVDAAGNAFVTGHTFSSNFPTMNPLQATSNGDVDAFVLRFNSSGNALIFSTYLGGTNGDYGRDIAIDAAGNAYVVGNTNSDNFPTLYPFQDSKSDTSEAFVTKFNSDGSALIYSTFLGGSGFDIAEGIAVDSEGNAFVAGGTTSENFPMQSPYQASYGGSGYLDGFVTMFNGVGTGLIYSTYLGGNGLDVCHSIAVDVNGEAFVVGGTSSSNFPIQSPFQASYGGFYDAFVTKFNRAGIGLIYSTYLGGSSDEGVFEAAIAIDVVGSAYVTGRTSSANFPIQDPFQVSLSGSYDAFVTKLGAFSCCTGTTGNVNLIGIVDLADLSAFVRLITFGDYPITCVEAVNVNGVGSIDLSDLSALVSYLTGGGYVLPNCP